MHTKHPQCPCVHAPRVVVVGTLLHAALVGAVLGLAFGFSPFTGWMRVGWHADLSVAGVVIDTPAKYAVVACLAAAMNALAVWYLDAVKPLLTFPVYNPECVQIDMFSRTALWLFTAVNFVCEALRALFDVLLYTAQLDLALIAALTGELVSVFVVRWLLGKKTFGAYAALGASGARPRDEHRHDPLALAAHV